MGRPLAEQRRLRHRGREFHFVSYDGMPGNPKRAQPATEPAWWLMSAGTRWQVLPYVPGTDEATLDRAFRIWLDAHAFPSLPLRGRRAS